MATKKPSAAQLAARKLFAARAKAGVFKGVKKTARSMATGAKASPRLLARRRRTAAGPKGFYANPSGAHKVNGYQVRKSSHGVAGELLATFPGTPKGKLAAVSYARQVADSKRTAVVIVGKR